MFKKLTWHLPELYRNDAILSRISWDGQVYFRCPSCRWEYRIDPVWVSDGSDGFDDMPCDSCSAVGLELVRHLEHRTVFCKDCETVSKFELTLFEESRCSACLSANISTVSSEILPPFTRRFGQLLTHKEHDWGEIGTEDGQMIITENMSVNLFPDFPFYLLTAAAFCRRLRLYGGYESDKHVELILNLEANAFRDYFRRSADLPAGMEALDLFEDCVRITHEPLQKALIEHNVSMAIYSMLAKFPEELVSVLTLRPNLRQEGIAAAKRALSVFSRFDEPAMRMQSARIQFLIGDLLKIGEASDDEIKESITYFDNALNSGALPPEMQLHVRESRGITLARIENIGPDLLATAINDLQQVVTKSEDDRVWTDKYAPLMELSRLYLRRGDLKKATELLENAAAFATSELDAINDEITLFQKGNIHAPIFEQLAICYTKANNATKALEALEMVRARTLRLHTMENKALEAARRESERSNVSRILQTMLGERKSVELASLKLRPITSFVDRLVSALNDVPTAIVSFIMLEGEVTIVAILSTEATGHRIQSIQSRFDFKVRGRLVKDILLLLEPTPLRETRLINLSRNMAEILISPIKSLLTENKIRRIAICPPAGMGHLPFEAFPETPAKLLIDSFDIFYLPSIGVGSDLAGASADTSDKKLLAVSYIDKDLPYTKREIEKLKMIWKDRMVLLEGEKSTKKQILDELKNNYAYLHFSCHGSFDVLDPLDSALHLVANPQQDRNRVTARDILSLRFENRPVVTLSACSTALVGATKANDYTGLTGSFLRAGARAIIGSRWPVYDDNAADFMTRFYERVYSSTRSPFESFVAVQREMQKSCGIEDWAAFGYLGLP